MLWGHFTSIKRLSLLLLQYFVWNDKIKIKKTRSKSDYL